MATVVIRDLKPETVERIKRRARANDKSMAEYLRGVLDREAWSAGAESMEDWLGQMAELRAAMARQCGPTTVTAADLIREGRDEQ